MSKLRDRFYQTKAQSFGALKRHRATQLDLQADCVSCIVSTALHAERITPANVDRLNADDVDVWQSILFPGGQ